MDSLRPHAGHRFLRGQISFFSALFLVPALFLPGGRAGANPDVYAALPPDTAVVQFGLGNLVGDQAEELAVFFTSGREARLAVFGSQRGSWVLLLDSPAPRLEYETGTPHGLELADTSGDARDEILTYSLSAGNGSMITRIATLEAAGGDPPSFRVLLEEVTSPPGYPLFGIEGGVPSVTFLKMPFENMPGYRRVYCWERDRFEKCLEDIWGQK